MKIESVRYDAGTMSAPAFLDIFFEDGTKKTFQGKKAKKLFAKYGNATGSEFDEADVS